MSVALPDPVIVVLVGASGSGKSTWAHEFFAPNQVLSSDALRAAAGRNEHDLDASDDAFAVLFQLFEARCRRRLSTVVDTLGFDPEFRERIRQTAHAAGLPCHVVVLDTPPARCRTQNAARAKKVPQAVLAAQLRRLSEVVAELESEGFDTVHRVTPELRTDVRPDAPGSVSVPDGVPSLVPKGGGAVRFGLHLSTFPWKPSDQRARLGEIAQAAEESGFDSLWVMDHFRQIPQLGRDFDDMPECLTTLAHLGAITTRVTIGSLVAAVTHRNIAVLGKSIASIDVASGGRVVCGIGLGWYQAEHEAYGLVFPSVADRYLLLEDALQALPLLWGKGSPAFDGHRFSAPALTCYPRPLQPRVPLLVGGSGARTLRLAAKYGDACNLFGEPTHVKQRIAVLRSHCSELGRDVDDIEITHLSTALVGESPRQIAETIDRLGVPRSRLASQHPGTISNHVARIGELVRAGVSHVMVSLPGITADEVVRFGRVIEATRALAIDEEHQPGGATK